MKTNLELPTSYVRYIFTRYYNTEYRVKYLRINSKTMDGAELRQRDSNVLLLAEVTDLPFLLTAPVGLGHIYWL